MNKKFYMERIDTYIDIENCKWLEDICSDDKCIFCKNRNARPYDIKNKAIALEIYRFFTSTTQYPNWTKWEYETLKSILFDLSDWLEYDLNIKTEKFDIADWKVYMESIIFMLGENGFEFYEEKIFEKLEKIKNLLKI